MAATFNEKVIINAFPSDFFFFFPSSYCYTNAVACRILCNNRPFVAKSVWNLEIKK